MTDTSATVAGNTGKKRVDAGDGKKNGRDSRPLRVAIIGAGPAGIYAADILKKSSGLDGGVRIDIFDDLPTPYGLIRYGVAPDHPRIKSIMEALYRILNRGDIRFFGNVKYGRDLSLAELRRFYDAVIFATGADTDAVLGVPGAHLKGVHGAAEVVKWYDGHPDAPRRWDLATREIGIIGNGNVALDVARMLSKPAEDLLVTEIPDNVYQGLKNSKVTDIHIFGRRGPQHAKFTPLELRELGRSPNVDIILNPEDFDLSDEDMAAFGKKSQTEAMMKTFMNWLAVETPPREEEAGALRRRLHLHFWRRPVRFIDNGAEAVAGAEFERTKVDDGAVVGTGEYFEYPLQAIYKAVGYFGARLSDLPYDEEKGVVKHEGGRILGADGRPAAGLYVTGWIKRGPVGLIGSTKSDALETVGNLVQDRSILRGAGEPDEEAVPCFLERKNIAYTTWDGWKRLEEHERNLGASWNRTAHVRERIKVVPREEMLAVFHSESSKTGPAAISAQ